MKLIIDGYNLIKKNAQTCHISSSERNGFLKKLGTYAKNKLLQIIVIFDGGESSFNYSEQVWGLQVIYSGFLETADDVIMRLIANHQYQQELMVITSDREIIDFAKQYTLDIIKSEDFYVFLQAGQDVIEPKKKYNVSNRANKTSANNDSALDFIMENASRQVQPKNEPEALPRAPGKPKISRQERHKLRKLKKL